jgi:hypothetical protein
MEIIKAQFKEIADAIRLKNHTTAAIPATELANEIKRVDLGMTAKSEIKADGTQILHIVKRDTQNTTGVLPSSGNFKKLHCFFIEGRIFKNAHKKALPGTYILVFTLSHLLLSLFSVCCQQCRC